PYPRHGQALPATNGATIWLPAHLATCDAVEASELYRAMALQQARRAMRGNVPAIVRQRDPLLRDTALVLEAQAAEDDIARSFPGLVPALRLLRRLALAARPPLAGFASARQPLEQLVRGILEREPASTPAASTTGEAIMQAERLLREWSIDTAE